MRICACDDYPLYDASSSLTGKTPASSSSGANNNNNNNGYVKATCRLVPLSIDLFDLVSLLAEGNRKSYPVKKLLLLLQKVLLVSLGVQHDASGGGDDCLALLKADGRLREGLPFVDFKKNMDTTEKKTDKLNTKSTPQDLHNLNLLTIQKYPAYYTPSITSLMPSPLTPLIPDPLSTISRRALVNGGSLGGLTQSIVQPILVSDGYMPTAIQEAVELVQDNMYIGLREVQMSREMVELEGVKKRGGNEGYDFGGASRVKSSSSTGGGGGGEKPFESVRLDRVEDLYRFLSPNIIVTCGMLIRLLYYCQFGQ
ncbi:hypothetical protein BDR26DRAFT_304934 [Obelidium mucronatum]|nr:hypothetical protein BDR26DRAFT_304934 [Obelidium mucronatum]